MAGWPSTRGIGRLTGRDVEPEHEDGRGLRGATLGCTLQRTWNDRTAASLGLCLKTPKLVPGKADREAQKAFLEAYQNGKETWAEQDSIYFGRARPIRITICCWVVAGSNAVWNIRFQAIPGANG